MDVLDKIKRYSNPRSFMLAVLTHFLNWLPDSLYLRMLFRLRTGKRLNLKDPRTFNEKLQWLKLHDRCPEYTDMVDKIEAKHVAAARIGKEYIIPTLGVWDSFDEIDFENLPDRFMLKTNHGGAGTGVLFCMDKKTFDKAKAKEILEKSLRSDIYRNLREWPYKNVKKRILAETMLEPDEGEEIQDFKFFCFNGEPKVMLVSHGRFTEEGVCFDYYDMNFNKLPFEQGGPNSNITMEKPKGFEKMKELAAKLSAGIPHARIDLYNLNGKIYFGEFTFFDSSGMAQFKPEEWDRIFGDWIELPQAK